MAGLNRKREAVMKRTLLAAAVVIVSMALTGCGGGGGNSASSNTIVTQILSDQAIDGDIQVPVAGPITVTEGMTFTIQSVFAGIDPATGSESRAFLDFPLSGPGGVPGSAVIVSATLDIVIDNILLLSPGDTVPLRVDLVSFAPPLLASDFDRASLPPLATISTITPIISADIGNHVLIDVTSLMVEAQNMALPHFQVRILEDFGPVTPGLIEIDDTTGANRGALAPLLQVSYF